MQFTLLMVLIFFGDSCSASQDGEEYVPLIKRLELENLSLSKRESTESQKTKHDNTISLREHKRGPSIKKSEDAIELDEQKRRPPMKRSEESISKKHAAKRSEESESVNKKHVAKKNEESVVKKHASDPETSLAKRAPAGVHGVYFTAGISQVGNGKTSKGNVRTYSNEDRLDFNHVTTNVGGALAHGQFVAPVAGVYEFTVSLQIKCRDGEDSEGSAYLRKNGRHEAHIEARAGSGAYQDESVSEILELAEGDWVDVVAQGELTVAAEETPNSLFSGKLLETKETA